MRPVIILLIGGILLSGCNLVYVDEIRLSPDRTIETLPDGSLFGDVRYLSCSGDILSFFDFTQQRGSLVDTSFSKGTTIGHKGRGANELILCDGMIVLQDTVIFTDFGSSSIKMFYNGGTKSIRLEKMRRFFPNRFAAYNDSLYFSFRSAENLIGAISLSDSTGHVRYFGQPFLKRNKVSTEVHNACNVFHYKDRILCVPQGLPLFYSVEKSSNTTTSYSLSRIKRYSANAKASKNINGMKDNQVFVINQDACLAGDY